MRIKRIVFERVLPILLFAVMVVRIFSSQTILINSEYVGLDSLLLDSKLFSALSLLGLWFGAACALAVVTRPFYNIKSLNNIVCYISPIVFIFNLVVCKNTVFLLTGNEEFNLTLLLFIIENGFGLIISIYYFINKCYDHV